MDTLQIRSPDFSGVYSDDEVRQACPFCSRWDRQSEAMLSVKIPGLCEACNAEHVITSPSQEGQDTGADPAHEQTATTIRTSTIMGARDEVVCIGMVELELASTGQSECDWQADTVPLGLLDPSASDEASPVDPTCRAVQLRLCSHHCAKAIIVCARRPDTSELDYIGKVNSEQIFEYKIADYDEEGKMAVESFSDNLFSSVYNLFQDKGILFSACCSKARGATVPERVSRTIGNVDEERRSYHPLTH